MATDLERYGVFALIFVVLLIVGISIWGPQREEEALLASTGAAAARVQPVAEVAATVGEGRERGVLADPNADYAMETLTAFYKVQGGDNPTKIARKLWRNDRHIDALLAANPGVRPNALRANDLLRLPNVDEEPDARYVIPGHELAQLAVSSGGKAAPEGAVTGGASSDPTSAGTKTAQVSEPPAKGADSKKDADSQKVAAPGNRDAGITAPKQTPAEKKPAERSSRYHVVRSGERLEKIAKRYYGSATHVAKIQAANPGLENPDRIRAGMKLILP